MNHRLSAFDRGVYHKLSRLLDQTPGDILIGDICAAYDPPLDGALAWAAVQRLEEADLVWLSTLHGVVSLSTHAHDLSAQKEATMPELPQGNRYAFNPQPDEPGVTRVTLEDVTRVAQGRK